MNQSQLAASNIVPFVPGNPSGDTEEFLTGLIANPKKRVYGRPGSPDDESLRVADHAGARGDVRRVSSVCERTRASPREADVPILPPLQDLPRTQDVSLPGP
jgi:hypothetical protein